MVVFTCNHCGDSLQKPKVEKHYNFVCRREKFLTCVDCLKDFIGEEYNVHIKCLTEDERYSAKGTFKNGDIKKGDVRQELWSDTIKSILNEDLNINIKCKNLLNHIANFNNVPKKKQKFMNFINSTMGGRVDNKTTEEVWNIIEERKSRVFKQPDIQNSDFFKRKLDNISDEQNDQDSKKKKFEILSNEIDDKNIPVEQVNADVVINKFNFKDEILKLLNKKESISISKLEKKILKKYSAHTEISDLEKFKKKFANKLKKIPNCCIEDERVVLKKM